MNILLLSPKTRAFSSTQSLFVNFGHLHSGKQTSRLCFLHSSFSTTVLSLFGASSHVNGDSEEDAESSPPFKDLPTTDPKECFKDDNFGKETHSEFRTKATSNRLQGIFRAILIGEAGCAPYQKILRVGKVTLFPLGTAGMRNNRKPYENETPEQYAKRSFVQWHRIAIYQYRLANLAMEYVKRGSQVYVEGNLESRIFLDPETNTIKQIQEVAVRKSGRIIFLDQNKVKI